MRAVGPRFPVMFAALIAAQAAHSVEEYAGRLYESFAPAQFVSGLVSGNLERGFVIANVVLVSFGVWCLLWPVRRRWASAVSLAWVWVGVELVNGVGHPLWSIRQGGYTPGVVTAPVLLALALLLARELRARPRLASSAIKASLAVIGCCGLGSTSLAAQSAWRKPEIAVLGGLIGGMPQAFSPCGEGPTPILGTRLGFRPVPFLLLGASASVHTGVHDENCGISAPPPSPGATGHFVTERYEPRLVGYPVYSAGLHVALSPFPNRKEDLQLSASLERAWPQRQWVPVVGGTWLMGSGPVRFLVDVEWAWYSAWRTRTASDLVNGTIVASTTSRIRENSRATRVRIGFLFRHGAFIP